jgi:hypothetical protein
MAGQAPDFPVLDPAHPAVGYAGTATDRVAALATDLRSGARTLEFQERSGYLGALLHALDVPVESQIVVFSRTSLQAPLVSSRNPRAVYFNDEVAVAWMEGGFIEIAAQDPARGTVFYVLPQAPGTAAVPRRDGQCLRCHHASATLGVPGVLARSVPTALDGAILPWLGNYTTDHRSPLAERWGGWYVTGSTGDRPHLGNQPLADARARELPAGEAGPALDTLAGRFDTAAHLSPFSDVVALLVFDHQVGMQNLLTRLGWEARILAHEGRDHDAAVQALRPTVAAVVDYALFVDAAPVTGVVGTSGFAGTFSAGGPRDSQGRSLRELDLDGRLFRYPCSYLIYSPGFTGLPATARAAVLDRLGQVLSGADPDPRYARLTADDRRAVVEILRDTLPDLPERFGSVIPRPSRP